MDKTLREHISFLEGRFRELNKAFMENGLSLDQRNQIESEIRAAETALDYYRKALELEARLR